MGSNQTRQRLYIILRDSAGESFVVTGYRDAWLDWDGEQVAWARDLGQFNSGHNSMPAIGAATIIVYRIGDVMTFRWGDEIILEVTEAAEPTEIASVAIHFAFTKRNYFDDGINESVGLIRCIDQAPITAAEDFDGQRPLSLNNHPNPFNPQTTIHCSLERPGTVDLCLYDLAGHEVKLLFTGWQRAGEMRAVWDGRDGAGRALPSGTYLVRLETDNGTATRRVSLIR